MLSSPRTASGPIRCTRSASSRAAAPRSDYTMQLPTEDQFLVTRGELLERLRGLLGGRAAEEMVFDEVTTGAENDLERATALARQMVAMFGMNERIGLAHCAQRQNTLPGRFGKCAAAGLQRADRARDRRGSKENPRPRLRRSQGNVDRSPRPAGSRSRPNCSSGNRWTRPPSTTSLASRYPRPRPSRRRRRPSRMALKSSPPRPFRPRKGGAE